MTQSLWEVLEDHVTMWFLVGFSILAIGVALERLIVQWRFLERARHLADTVGRCLTRGALSEGRSACERSRSPLADVFLVGYERLGRSKKGSLAGAVHRERMRVTSDLKRWLWILGTIGATAPFVGLFGTVVGIMEAFGEIGGAEGAAFALVAPGISQALYATAAGILVAVEAVILYNFFNQRLGKIGMELKLMTDEFLELLEECEPEESDEIDASGRSSSSRKGRDEDGARSAA
jgi:biopolymer transport protein ExbB